MRSRFTGSVLLAGLLLGATGAVAWAADAERVDVPIHQTVLPDGMLRYSVPISIGGGGPIEAMLDTGSFGVRVLSGALSPSQYEATTAERKYPFNGGARLNGVLAKAVIGVGDAKTDTAINFQLVQSVDCVEQMPKCFASRVDPAAYRIGGDGIEGQGFQALVGVSLRKAMSGDAADNPLGGIGDGRWIIELPRPGSAEPGHLVVNPTPDEVAQFKTVRLAEMPEGTAEGAPGWRDAALNGCVVKSGSSEKLCGLTVLDSGAAGMVLRSPDATSRSGWSSGTAARFELSLDDGDKIEVPFKVGQDPSTRVVVLPQQAKQAGGARLSAGPLPFYAYAVLYDDRNGTLGFRKRDAAGH